MGFLFRLFFALPKWHRRLPAFALALLLQAPEPGFSWSTDPTPLPENRNPCALFTDASDYLTSVIIRRLEGGTVSLRVPRVYNEDAPYGTKVAPNTAALFRVEIGSFAPVSSAEAAKRNTIGIWNWMGFLVTDYVPLGRMALIMVENGRADANFNAPLSDYPQSSGPFSLSEIKSKAGEAALPFRKQVFLAATNQDLTAVLSCNAEGSVKNPGCEHYFYAAGLDVKLTYKRTELPNWQALQGDVTKFLICATSNSM